MALIYQNPYDIADAVAPAAQTLGNYWMQAPKLAAEAQEHRARIGLLGQEQATSRAHEVETLGRASLANSQARMEAETGTAWGQVFSQMQGGQSVDSGLLKQAVSGLVQLGKSNPQHVIESLGQLGALMNSDVFTNRGMANMMTAGSGARFGVPVNQPPGATTLNPTIGAPPIPPQSVQLSPGQQFSTLQPGGGYSPVATAPFNPMGNAAPNSAIINMERQLQAEVARMKADPLVSPEAIIDFVGQSRTNIDSLKREFRVGDFNPALQGTNSVPQIVAPTNAPAIRRYNPATGRIE